MTGVPKTLLLLPTLASVSLWVSHTPFESARDAEAQAPKPVLSAQASPQSAGVSAEQRAFEAMETESALRAALSAIPRAVELAIEGDTDDLRQIDARVQALAARDEELFTIAAGNIIQSIENLEPASAAFLVRSLVRDLSDPSASLAELLDRVGDKSFEGRLGQIQLYAVEETGRRLESDPVLLPSQRLLRALVRRAERNPELRVAKQSRERFGLDVANAF